MAPCPSGPPRCGQIPLSAVIFPPTLQIAYGVSPAIASNTEFSINSPADATFTNGMFYRPPLFATPDFDAKTSLTGIFASKTRLKNPTIISSQLWSPQVTSFVGSALAGLFGELSKCAVHSIFVPFGSTIGFARLYQSCQCQS